MPDHFQFLNADDARRLAEHARHFSYPAGQVILLEGQDVPGVFVVRSGRVGVEKRFARTPLKVTTLGPGDVFGEMSFIDGRLASATVVAVEDCTIDLLEKQHIEVLLATVPGFSKRFYQSLAYTLSERLRNTTDNLAEL